MSHMNDPIDVVYLIGQLSFGGTERQLLLLAKSLDRTRFRPWVICISDDSSLAWAFEELDCPTFVLGRPRGGRIVTLIRLLKLLKKIRPTILHSFGFTARVGVLASKVSSRAMNIMSIRTNPYWESAWDKAFDRIALRSSDMILANSRQALITLESNGLTGHGAGRVVYNGLDLSNFDSLLPDLRIGSTAELNGLPTVPGKCICSVASLRDVKDIQNLLKAFAIVQRSVKDAKLWIVGDGPLRTDLQRLSSSLGIDGNVSFLGLRSDIPAILTRATIGVNSSQVEGMSNAIIEYMAARLPVVATRVGGNPELVVQGETGLLVSPQNPESLAEAILSLLNNPELATHYGEGGRRRVEELFTVDQMVSETQSVYNELLGTKGFAVHPATANAPNLHTL